MVSEDSQELRWFAMVHRLDDGCDVCHPIHREVLTLLHETNDDCELFEVAAFRGSQRIGLEERNDDIPQVGEPRHTITTEIFSVIVLTTIHVHLAASEEADKILEHIPARLALHHVERWLQLPAEASLRIAEERTAETAFPIHKTGNPSLDPESFLLVFRTSHIFTEAHKRTLQTGCITESEQRVVKGYTGFSSI
jgi:hypothetical protein